MIMMSKRKLQVLFVCAGNICRSPMAEYLLRRRLGPQSPWDVRSAGLCAVDGEAASEPAVDVMRLRHIDLRPHRSRRVTKDIIDAATLIVVMTQAQVEELRLRYPEAQDRIYLLRSFHPQCKVGDIRDPIGNTAATYVQICREINEHMPNLADYLESCQAGR